MNERTTRILSRLLALPMALALLAPAAENPVGWTLVSAPRQPVRPGEIFSLRMAAAIQPGWHLYSMKQAPGGPIATDIFLGPGEPFQISGPVETPKPISIFDPNFNMQVEFYTSRAEFRVHVKAAPSTAPGRYSLVLEARFQTCNDRLCLPPRTVKLPAEIVVGGRPALH